MPQPPGRRPGKRPPAEAEGTRLESDEEIREAIRARAAQRKGKAPAAPPVPVGKAVPVAVAVEPEPEPDTPHERPQQRPPMALLCILDDGKQDGEFVRLRGDRCLLGRADGDVRIPHDLMMSGRHAEIVRQKTKEGGHRWVLVDLESTNGSWVRVGRTILHDQAEILIGRGQYRFEAGSAETAAAPVTSTETTRAYVPGAAGALLPSLVEVTPAGPGPRYPLTQAEYWVGRDPRACAIARPDDPVVSPRHARLYRDPRGQWYAENNKSVNGLWLRVDEIPLGATCQFRMGEQRFLFRVL
jgi:pSer/pThr/pTyr-binding forkhead associated (FHA) protein